jgi:hypothetical protein
VAAIKHNKREGEDLTLPPSFPQSFYLALNKAAKKAGMARAAFAMKAIRFYSAALEKKKSPATKALGVRDADKFAEMSRQVSKKWWATLTPEERVTRAKAAAEARWSAKPKKAK